MGHIDRQLASKSIEDKKAYVFKYVTKRVRSAARRANHFKILPPIYVALMGAEAAIGVVKSGQLLSMKPMDFPKGTITPTI